jgi:predicted nucleic acid-binding protein
MGIKYLWDTNTCIYYLQQQFPPSAEKFIDSTIQEFQPALSIITEIELLCWKDASQKDIELLNYFIADSIIFELTKTIKVKTVEIRRANKIKLPDAVIAAAAMENDLILLTRNTSDFKNIRGLKLLNPFEL